MNLPEDRHPLLYVYLDDEEPDRVRSRCVSQGAATLLGKWPDHLTFSWTMAVIGLISLLTCFLLAVVLLILSSSNHHYLEKRALIDKCERNQHVIQLVHMKNLEDLIVNENATYFVEIFTSETESKENACSVESYLKNTNVPVYLISIFSEKPSSNFKTFNKLELVYRHFKTIVFSKSQFFNKTVFGNIQTDNVKLLAFLAKVLVAWNVGGTVIDSRVVTIKKVQGISEKDNKTVAIGTFEDDVLLISTKRFCHAYIFDLLKTMTETKNLLKSSPYDMVKAAERRFCHGRWNCNGIRFLSKPEFCSPNDISQNCTFLVPKPKESDSFIFKNFTQTNFCPIVKALM